MNIYDFIVDANNEFAENGRSEKFISMENRVLRSSNIISQYFFARYTKGIDVSKFQELILEKGSVEDGFYFALFVPGARVKPFLKKAIYNEDVFWIRKFVEVGCKLNQIDMDEAKKILARYDINLGRGSNFNLDSMLESAKHEYKINGRSNLFKSYEQTALHALGNSNLVLFAKKVDGADLRAIERSAMMRGDSFVMYSLVKDIEGIDKRLMLTACKMAKLDYVAIEKDENGVAKEVETTRKKIAECDNREEKRSLTKKLNQLLNRQTYQNWVDRNIMCIENSLLRDLRKSR